MAPDARPRVRGIQVREPGRQDKPFREALDQSPCGFRWPHRQSRRCTRSALERSAVGRSPLISMHTKCLRFIRLKDVACRSRYAEFGRCRRGVTGSFCDVAAATSGQDLKRREAENAARAEVRGAAGRAAGAGGVASDHKSERHSISRRSDLRSLVTPPAWLRQAAGRTACHARIASLGEPCPSANSA